MKCTQLIILIFPIMGCIVSQEELEMTNCIKCGQRIRRAHIPHHICEENMQVRKKKPLNKPILYPVYQIPQFFDPTMYQPHEVRMIPQSSIFVKIPIDKQQTIFKWEQQQYYAYTPNITRFPSVRMKTRTFQQKLLWFRQHMERLRISWTEGAAIVKVDRSNLLLGSKDKLKNANLHKEVKIEFTDQKVHDAGGLLREWIHLALKEVFSKQNSIFQLCQTEETAYKIKWDTTNNEKEKLDTLEVMGMLLGKAIFDRISINCPLDKTILRQIISEPIHMNDVYSYDMKMFSSWNKILHSKNVDELFLTFSELKVYSDDTKQQIELIPEGSNIDVNDDNKEQYIQKIIQLYCVDSVKKYIDHFKKGIYRVVPATYFEIFQPYELDMMINGPTEIDVSDWMRYTQYKGYTDRDQVIQWFWTTVFEMSENQLKNLLHFSTGTTRVPILGFQFLEGNRNSIARFTIQKVEYDESNPYPKGHTCFNRIELPEYENYEELYERLMTLVNQEVTHYGLD